MDYYAPQLAGLIEKFEQLPGIGHKTARRLAFFVLAKPESFAEDFASALVLAKREIRNCRICQNLAEDDLCNICACAEREQGIICVVESPKEVVSIEKTREYKGMYHVLHGVLSPMEGISPEDIKIKELLARLSTNCVKEIIMATNPTVEGEATAMYISRLVKPLGVRVTRIAHGVPVGGDLEYADEVTLLKAIEGRTEI